MNLATLAQRQAERYGDRLLALVNDEPMTYADPAEAGALCHRPAGARHPRRRRGS
jgi:hypothetical protein